MRDENDLERVVQRDLGRIGPPAEERWVPTARRSSWLRTAFAVPVVAAILIAAVGLGLALGERRSAEVTGPVATQGASVAASSPSASPGRVLSPVPTMSDLGYTIVVRGPWRRSTLMSIPTGQAKGLFLIGQDVWTRRSLESERALLASNDPTASAWALVVAVDANPRGLTLQEWVDQMLVGLATSKRVTPATIDGRPALIVFDAAVGHVVYVVAKGDEVMSISYRLQGDPPEHTPEIVKGELDSMIASIGHLTASFQRPSPSPSAGAIAGFAGVQMGSIAALRGDVVFAVRALDEAGAPIAELWAVPLAPGSQAVRVLRYPRGINSDAWLSHYLSPDGKRYAFALDGEHGVTRIAIADLATGKVSWLTTDDSKLGDSQPAWDPSGTRIAFVRSDGGSWLVNADGSGLKRIVPGGSGTTYIHQWTPDGAQVAFYQGAGYETVDVATGARSRADRFVSADASWRTATPRLLGHGWETVSGGDQQVIFTTDRVDGARTVLVRAASTSDFISAPRWRPGSDEFLYVASSAGKSVLRVRTSSGAERTLPVDSVFSPAWSPDGSAIVYLRSENIPQPGQGEGGSTIVALVVSEIRLVQADGTGDRLLMRSTDPGKLTPGWCVCNDGLAVRRY